jgi:hypothetical protein
LLSPEVRRECAGPADSANTPPTGRNSRLESANIPAVYGQLVTACPRSGRHAAGPLDGELCLGEIAHRRKDVRVAHPQKFFGYEQSQYVYEKK